MRTTAMAAETKTTATATARRRGPAARPRWMLALATLATLAALLWGATPAAACMCTEPPPPAEALEAAAAVFAGTVVTVERAEWQTGYGKLPRTRATLRLSAVWKPVAWAERPAGDTVQLWTGLGGGDCGYGFEEGTEVLVYANELRDGSLSTDICTRTKPLAAARARGELEALGEPHRHSPDGSPDSSPNSSH